MKDGEPEDGTEDLIDPLCEAAWDGDPERISELVRGGADVESYNRWGTTALHVAIENSEANAVRTLIAMGADVNRRTRDGNGTPLLIAVEAECDAALQQNQPFQADVLRLLLAYGARVNDRDCKELTALTWAVKYKNKAAQEILRQAGGSE